LLEDGRVLEASSVVWCTGFVPGFDWIDIPVFDHRGFPVQHRGVVDSVPGLFFMGLPFQYSLSSALVGGVGRDADYVAGIIESRT
jgi:putative flavoprotein involved in K+ transport